MAFFWNPSKWHWRGWTCMFDSRTASSQAHIMISTCFLEIVHRLFCLGSRNIDKNLFWKPVNCPERLAHWSALKDSRALKKSDLRCQIWCPFLKLGFFLIGEILDPWLYLCWGFVPCTDIYKWWILYLCVGASIAAQLHQAGTSQM